jgi:hypothetical protein
MTAAAERARADLIVELLNSGSETRTRVTGSSMLPSTWPGDMLSVRCRPISEGRLGDVALFTREDRLFADRVVVSSPASRILQRAQALRRQLSAFSFQLSALKSSKVWLKADRCQLKADLL